MNSRNIRTGLFPCKCVGMVVKDGDSYLSIYRNKFPTGISLPAGHIEKGETPLQAMRRELTEETGLHAKRWRHLLTVQIKNPCARGKDFHEWDIYEVTQYTGVLKNNEPDKHAYLTFMQPEDLAVMIKNEDADTGWKELLKILNII